MSESFKVGDRVRTTYYGYVGTVVDVRNFNGEPACSIKYDDLSEIDFKDTVPARLLELIDDEPKPARRHKYDLGQRVVCPDMTIRPITEISLTLGDCVNYTAGWRPDSWSLHEDGIILADDEPKLKPIPFVSPSSMSGVVQHHYRVGAGENPVPPVTVRLADDQLEQIIEAIRDAADRPQRSG